MFLYEGQQNSIANRERHPERERVIPEGRTARSALFNERANTAGDPSFRFGMNSTSLSFLQPAALNIQRDPSSAASSS